MVHYKVEELSERYRFIVQRMIDDGILETNEDGTISASEEMLEIFVILCKLGLV